ncbi:MAG: M28 family peptidase [Cyanobacteria bacterium SZAS LIN-3]|nr:M28 family peptidase [Cyanobacteria bacterium SZAS LIN-3]
MGSPAIQSSLAGISAAKLLEHISTLASDKFEGRAPGTEGETLTLDYLVGVCKQLNLSPAGDHGTYLQSMDVTGLSMTGEASFRRAEGQTLKLNTLEDVVLRSKWRQERLSVDNEMVFVGYGIVAPEYDWDDYKDLDVRGKTVVMLIGDPSRPDPQDPSQLDKSFFKGRALTYYGRWTYKFEIASAKGAAAVLIVHDTAQAGYGWDVVVASWGGENFELAPDPDRVRVEGWISASGAERVANLGGHDFKALRASAQTRDFRPVSLGIKASLCVSNTMRQFKSSNVVAKLHGSDPALAHECLVYCAHWDHFGKREKDGQVEILSGALDNGSGVAVVLEIARALSLLAVRPRRSVVFLFTTLEEHGLLGAQHYVQYPHVALENTVAVINFDIMNPWGRTRNLISVARGHSDLDEVIERHAAAQGRTMGDDQEPDKGYFFRSDHLEFIRKGVPALFFLNPGDDFIDQPPGYALQRRIEYLTSCYHKAGDKVHPDWDLSGMVEDAQLLFLTGLEVANSDVRPSWKEGSEFYRPARGSVVG